MRPGLGEVEVKIGFEWDTTSRLEIWTTDTMGFASPSSTIPLARYTPVEATVRADTDESDFHQQVHDLALDCVNQGGIAHLQTIERSTP